MALYGRVLTVPVIIFPSPTTQTKPDPKRCLDTRTGKLGPIFAVLRIELETPLSQVHTRTAQIGPILAVRVNEPSPKRAN
jgi:hypothetical protein